MDKCYKDYNNDMYDVNCLNLLGALFPCCRPARNKIEGIIVHGYNVMISSNVQESPDSWLFCSEFVAKVYQDLCLIEKSKDTRDVVPMDFVGYDQDGIPKLCNDPKLFVY